MDDTSEDKRKPIDRLDSVYELKYEIPKAAETDVSTVGKQSDDAAPATHATNVYNLVTHDAQIFFNFIRTLKLEMVMFIYMFSYVMRSVSSTTMVIEKVCLVHLGHPQSVCDNLDLNKTIKMQVEKLANNYNLGHTLLQVTPSAILACFIGPWSDRYSRKIPIIVALIGIILDGFGSIACASYKYSRVEYYMLSALFTGVSGGFVSALTIVYSCASDTTTKQNRTLKYTLLELAFGMGMPLGAVAGGWIFKSSGYVPVFAVSVAGHFFGLLWVIFFIEETRGLDNKDPLKVKLRAFFTLDAMFENFRTVTKRRPHRARLQIWLLTLSMCVLILSLASTSGISYLYVYHQYNWGNTKYSTVSAIFSIFGMITLLIAVPVMTKLLKVGDAALGIVGSASVIAKNITISFASKEGLYYLGNLFGMLSGMASLAGRARMSKIIAKEDLGKVFSFVSITESIFPIIGTAVFAQVFNASLGFDFPGLVYFILGVLVVISLIVYIWIALLPTVDYDALHEEGPKQEESAEENSVEFKGIS